MKTTGRIVMLAVADTGVRQRLRTSLSQMRWTVAEAAGGADAMVQMEECAPEALLMDPWLPDLHAAEFVSQVRALHPAMDVLRLDGEAVEGAPRNARRHELLHALRELEEAAPAMSSGGGAGFDGASWLSAPVTVPVAAAKPMVPAAKAVVPAAKPALQADFPELRAAEPHTGVDGLVGASEPMRELCRMIRLVAPRMSRVLILGETGTGKELVAQALHRLSPRAGKPLAVLNCAAIPESLLEAELFGHTRGAFTGAVQSRVGRIEAAHGGTLFLDEIGEMPLALQSKMLRFLESGELQRVGDNETVRVDVRVIAATHQPLEQRAEEGAFRLDLYHRLAVFPIEVPPLRERLDDLPMLAEHFLTELGRSAPRKRLRPEALELLQAHGWPGNVRELAHVLERATVLCDERAEIGAAEIRLRRAPR